MKKIKAIYMQKFSLKLVETESGAYGVVSKVFGQVNARFFRRLDTANYVFDETLERMIGQ